MTAPGVRRRGAPDAAVLATAVASAAWGTVLVVRAPSLIAAGVPGPVRRRDVMLCRALGVRHLVESAALLVNPAVAPVPLLLNGVHAVTMVPLAVASRRYRRPATLSAVIAAALAFTSTAGPRWKR